MKKILLVLLIFGFSLGAWGEESIWYKYHYNSAIGEGWEIQYTDNVTGQFIIYRYDPKTSTPFFINKEENSSLYYQLIKQVNSFPSGKTRLETVKNFLASYNKKHSYQIEIDKEYNKGIGFLYTPKTFEVNLIVGVTHSQEGNYYLTDAKGDPFQIKDGFPYTNEYDFTHGEKAWVGDYDNFRKSDGWFNVNISKNCLKKLIGEMKKGNLFIHRKIEDKVYSTVVPYANFDETFLKYINF